MRRLVVIAVIMSCLAGRAAMADTAVFQLTLKDHQFAPAELHVPAGQPAVLEITNTDATPEEFESGQLAIEKIIVGGGTIRLRLRPLGPGRYTFIGEYHNAKGVIIAEAAKP